MTLLEQILIAVVVFVLTLLTGALYVQGKALRRLLKRAQTKISEYENTTTWFTTCHGCADHLDREYAADYRATKAEAEVARLRALIDITQQARRIQQMTYQLPQINTPKEN